MSKKNDFYEPWQQHKQLKTMEISEAWSETDNEGHIHHSNLNPLTKLTSGRRSTKLKDISQYNISQMITKTAPISTRIVISYTMNGILFWVCRKSIETETTWSEFYNGGKAFVEQILASKDKSRTVRPTVRDLSGKVNHLSKVIWDRKIKTKLKRSTSSNRMH